MTPSLFDLLHSHLPQFDTTRLRSLSAVVGYDGFVDDMTAVIQNRPPSGPPEFVPTIAEFGKMVSDAAGRSFGREILIKRTEPGGNAPNLAEGLLDLGVRVHFFGTIGDPVDPVFLPFKGRCDTCETLGPSGRTLALEFADGKLQFNNTGPLSQLTPAVIETRLPLITAAAANASLFGFANWSRYPHMTECWRFINERILATLTSRPWVIVDLADPSGRDPAQIAAMFDAVRAMTATCRVVFGANLAETGVLLNSFGQPKPGDDPTSMADAAESLRSHIGVHMVAVHSQRRAAAAWADPSGEPAWRAGRIAIDGAYNPAPIRTTGVGDRFNAGLSAALLAGFPPEACLALGCAAGAWFVTVGRPLTPADFPSLADRLITR